MTKKIKDKFDVKTMCVPKFFIGYPSRENEKHLFHRLDLMAKAARPAVKIPIAPYMMISF